MHRADPEPSGRSAVDESQRLLELARSHSASLKKAFNISAGRRNIPAPWERLGDSIAVLLDQTLQKSHEYDWFAQTDSMFFASVTDFIRRKAPNSSRGRHYHHAAREVMRGVEFESRGLDQATIAYWRHAALIWISLWHLADIPQLTADDAKKFLSVALKLEAV